MARNTAQNSGAIKKLALVLPILLLPVVGYAVYWMFPSASNLGYDPEQPIPFSHRLHAGQYKINCLYCHSNAEKSVHATVPAVATCMNCHKVVKTDSPWIQKITEAYNTGKPIEWVRVHELPDFVRFNHKRHVGKGVACQTCHGPVEEMDRIVQSTPLTMGWCIDCHRGTTTPKQVLAKFKPEERNAHGHIAATNCVTCHY